jgi:Arc/MetJ-type ribon-helix-helix transcriptional regulator
MSEVVREAVTQLLDRIAQQTPGRLEDVAGKYTGGALEDMKDHDRAWVESIR